MKNFIITLSLAVLFAVSLASCSTTNKVASKNTQTQTITQATQTMTSQTSARDTLAVRTTEIDLSQAVIDFTRIEYADGTTATMIDSVTPRSDAILRLNDREETEPPNVNGFVKSVTSGRVTINTNKQKQTTTDAVHEEDVQTTTDASVMQKQEQNEQSKTEEKPKRSWLWIGIAIGAVVFALLLEWSKRILRKLTDLL